MPPEEPQQVVGGEVAAVEPVGLDVASALADIEDSLSLTSEEEHKDESVQRPAASEAGEGQEAVVKAEPEKTAANPNDLPPDTWRKEAKEAWATVPPTVREELRKREADIAGYVERVKQPVAIGERFASIVNPYLPMLSATKTDPWENLQSMLAVQERLTYGSPDEKVSILSALAKEVGVKLENGQLSAPTDGTAQYVRQLEQRIAGLEGGVKQVTNTVQEARQAELQESVVKFAQDIEAHPFFYDVADKITHLIRTGAVSSLDEAYQTAIMADPITRQKVVAAEAARVAEANTKAATERAAKARGTSKINVRSTARGGAAQQPGSIDDTLKDTLAAINSRTH